MAQVSLIGSHFYTNIYKKSSVSIELALGQFTCSMETYKLPKYITFFSSHNGQFYNIVGVFFSRKVLCNIICNIICNTSLGTSKGPRVLRCITFTPRIQMSHHRPVYPNNQQRAEDYKAWEDLGCSWAYVY